MNDPVPALNLDNVTFRFGDRIAVDGLTLAVRPGEVFGLLGPNGAGKTTSVHLSVGLLAPASGSVSIGSLGSPRSAATRQSIGIAPQALALYEELTGAENLQFYGRLYGLSGSDLATATEKALSFTGLADRGTDRVKTYSGGMKRRLNLAVGIVHQPKLLLLDEPTVGVDPQSRNAIFENIEQLRQDGCTIIYTSHYMEEVQRLCDRVAIMDHGKLLAMGTVDELIAQHAGTGELVVETTEQELRVTTDDPVGELQRIHDSHSVTRFRVENPTLEQVFLNLTGRHLRDE